MYTHFELPDSLDTLKDVIYKLVDVFPLLWIEKGKQFFLLDFTELIFSPGLVHQILTIDETIDVQEETDTTTDSVEEENFFYKKPGPIPKQEQYPQLVA